MVVVDGVAVVVVVVVVVVADVAVVATDFVLAMNLLHMSMESAEIELR